MYCVLAPGMYSFRTTAIVRQVRVDHLLYACVDTERVVNFGNRKRRNPWFVKTRDNFGLFHALVAVHHTVVGAHRASVDSRS